MSWQARIEQSRINVRFDHVASFIVNISAIDSHRQTIWIADAHRGDGKRFIVRADEKLTAFAELESAVQGPVFSFDKSPRFFLVPRSFGRLSSGSP